MDPLLIEVPHRVETPRLVLRGPRAGDGAAACAAVQASIESLRPWMPWAQQDQTLAQAESYCRRQQALFILREELSWFVYERGLEGPEGPVLGGIGLHHIDWSERRFEIGWWRRTGLEGIGVAGEAVWAVTRLAFDTLGARRVEARMDETNQRSWRLAERMGFTFEGVLRLDSSTPGGTPRSTRVYSRVRGVEEPGAPQVGPKEASGEPAREAAPASVQVREAAPAPVPAGASGEPGHAG